MVFLTDDENISSVMNDVMNDSDVLLTTASWAAEGNFSNHSDFTTVVKMHTNSGIEQMVSKATLDKVTFVFVMVLIPIFAIFGVVGNVLSLVVLVQHRMRSITNMCLAALALSDLLLLLHSIAFSAIRIHGLQDPMGAQRARVTTFPFLGAYGSIVCARITTWLTTMLGVERCIAVYFPIQAKFINSRRSTFWGIGVIYVATLLAFLPTALQYKISHFKNSKNITIPKLELSPLGQNKTFTLTYSLFLNILFRFIPLAVLIVANAIIINTIRRAKALRRNMSWGSGTHGRGFGNGNEQTRITKMLLAVSGVFLVCTLPGAINTIVSRLITSYSRLGVQKNVYMIVSIVTYFLETLNSSVNFIIYMAFSRRFWNTYQEIFCCRSSSWQPMLRTVRFAPRGPSSTSLHSSHEMHCMQYRPLPAPAYPNSSGAQRIRFLANGFLQSSFDVDDVQLLNGRPANNNVPVHGACCTCHQGNWSRSRSRSRSQSQSHSSDSAAQQYS